MANQEERLLRLAEKEKKCNSTRPAYLKSLSHKYRKHSIFTHRIPPETPFGNVLFGI
jgi:hypothetical protein